MKKEYVANYFYYYKSILILLTIVAAYFTASLFANFVGKQSAMLFKVNPELGIRIFEIIMIVLCIAIAGLIILRKKPKIVITEEMIKTNRFSIRFASIASYNRGRGGSEAYFLTKSNKRKDLELSWFTKADREEIETYIEKTVQEIAAAEAS